MFNSLDSLQKDRFFLQYLLHRQTNEVNSHKLQFHGAGLFQQTSSAQNRLALVNKSTMKRLHTLINQAYGSIFLERRYRQLEQSIAKLTSSQWSIQFTSPTYTLADRYQDLQSARQALMLLQHEQILATDAIRTRHQHGFELSPTDAALLLEFGQKLQKNVLQLLKSDRPDWAYALLVNVARLMAVDASLSSQQWVFIDDFANNSEWVQPGQIPDLQLHINESRLNWLAAKSGMFKTGHLSESDYSRLEMIANHYAELGKAEQGLQFRYHGEQPLPDKPLPLTIDVLPNLSVSELKQAVDEVNTNENSLHQQLALHNRYDLLTRNCVTELFRSIDSAFVNSLRLSDLSNGKPGQLTQQHLGGYIRADYNFIPWVAFQSIQNQLHVTDNHVLRSYRGLQLEKIDRQTNGIWQTLSEMSTLSSRWYHFNNNDAWFIFFTDDQLLLRPVFGSINTLTAIGQSLLGLLTLPFDEGKNFHAGVTGILMSLSELVFVNIRKGSYPYLPHSVALSALSVESGI